MQREINKTGVAILLVEESGQRNKVGSILEAKGHSVVKASSVEDAFECAVDFTGIFRPDVIILNVGSIPSTELSALALQRSSFGLNSTPLMSISSDVAGTHKVALCASDGMSKNGENLWRLITESLSGRGTAAATSLR